MFVVLSVQVHPVVFLVYFIYAAVILLASLALVVQLSLLYDNTGRSSILNNFIHVFFGLNIFLIIVISFQSVDNVHYFFVRYKISLVKGSYLFNNFVIYYNLTCNWISSYKYHQYCFLCRYS